LDDIAAATLPAIYDALSNKAEHPSDFDARLPPGPSIARGHNLAETIPQDVWNATTSGHPEPGITELTISFA